jgi:alcohol dehydrogenase
MNLFMPYVLDYNKSVNGAKIADLLLPLAGADIYAQTPADKRADKAIAYIRQMRDQIYEQTKLPRTLQETGKITREQLVEVAKKALDDGSIIFNPKEANIKDLLGILEKAW